MTLYGHRMILTKRGPIVVGGFTVGDHNGYVGDKKEMYLLKCKEANMPSACRWEELPHKLEVGRGNHVLIPLPDSWLQQTGICSKGNFSS